jgi:outer membrane protein TolC
MRPAGPASPDVAAAQARVDESRSALATARSGAAPSLVSNYAQTPQGNPPGPNITSRQVNTGLQWTIGDFIAFGPAAREAAFTLAAAEADEHAAENAERVKVIGLYFDALKARSIAGARRDALAFATAQRDAAGVRAKAGDAPRLDVVRSEVAVAKAQADLEEAVAADENADDALRVETGAGADALTATTPGALPAINPALFDPHTVVGLATAMRPEIASARLLAQAAQADIGVARAAGFPTLTVSGGYLVGTDSGVPVNAPTINANLTLPLGSGAHDRIATANAKAREAQAKAVSVEREIVLDAGAAARSLGASQRAAGAMMRARESAQEEWQATELGYRNRASSSLDVESARSTYTQALVDEQSALYDLDKARATLDVEIGR